jgi:hypothetical protein
MSAAPKTERPYRMNAKPLLSGGDWHVPIDVQTVETEVAGLIVTTGGTIIADCRSTELPDHVCRANARAISALPLMIAALEQVENYFGDLPSRDPGAMTVYGATLQALQAAGLRRRNGL